MVAQSPDVVSTVPGQLLTDPAWVAARIDAMSHTWGTEVPRVAGTLWWCMVASTLVEQIAVAYAAGTPAPVAALALVLGVHRAALGRAALAVAKFGDGREPAGET